MGNYRKVLGWKSEKWENIITPKKTGYRRVIRKKTGCE